MLPQIAKPTQASRNRGRSDHKLQQPFQKKHYHKPQFQTRDLKLPQLSHNGQQTTAQIDLSQHEMAPGWKINVHTLPSAPSSTPSSPSTISVDTETPPEGCRCFCPSIFRSLDVGKKEHYYRMQGQLPMVNTNQQHQVRVLLCGNKPTPPCHLQESISF